MKKVIRKEKHIRKIEKKSAQKKKYPLRGAPIIYRDPFTSAAVDDWESLNNAPVRVPGIDKGRVIIKPDFDAALSEFNDEWQITLGEIYSTLRGAGWLKACGAGVLDL